MTIYDLKTSFQNILRPLTNRLAAAGCTANQITIGAMCLSFACAGWIYFSHGSRASLLAVPFVLFVRMALNAIDGMLAREHDMKTRLGALLNELGDVLSDSAIYLAFAAAPGIATEPLVVIVVLAVVSEMTGVIAVQIGSERRYDGPMGKSDRAFCFSCLALVLAFDVHADMWLAAALWVVAALLGITILNRARRALTGAD